MPHQTATRVAVPTLTKTEFMDAIAGGVADGIYQIVRSASGMPGHDFFDEIKLGVKEAVLQLGRENPDLFRPRGDDQ